MFGSILHRMIFLELVRVFALSLVGIMGILVMAGVVSELSQQGLNPGQILAVIPLLIPSFLPYTIPATTLFAACVVYGRLSADNEILAIKAAGVNMMKVVWPAVLLGALMSGITMGLYYQLIPYTHYLLRTQFLNEVEESLYAMLRKDHCITRPDFAYKMWVRQVQGTRLIDALFKKLDARRQHYEVVARAKEATIRYDAAKHRILVHMRHCHLLGENGSGNGYFQDKIWPVELPEDFGAVKNPKPRALSCPQLQERRAVLVHQVEEVQADMALTVSRMAQAEVPTDLPKHLVNLQNKEKMYRSDIFGIDTEVQMRPALACGCLCFVLVGCPVGVWFSRSDYLSAFITCFLPIVFLYYPLILCGCNLAKQGRMPAFAAMWIANAVVGFAGLLLYRKLLRN